MTSSDNEFKRDDIFLTFQNRKPLIEKKAIF